MVLSAIRLEIEMNRMKKSSIVRSEENRLRSSDTHLATYTSSTSVFAPEAQVVLALARMRASSAFFLSERMKSSVDLAAASKMAIASTAPTSSSSLRADSSAPATSSSATWKETETLRSEPIEDKALAAVPPTPGTSMSFAQNRMAVLSYRTLLTPFSYAKDTLLLRELLAGAARGKRGRESAPVDALAYGATVGAVLQFVAHPGSRRAPLHRRLRAKVAGLAGLHARTRGPDGDLLAAGMAAARVPSTVVRLLPEMQNGRTHSRQGSLCTILGACVALLVAVEMVSEIEVPDPDVLSPAAERASAALEDMTQRASGDTRAAEARAMRRLAAAARTSWQLANEIGLEGQDRLVLQLREAGRAAFPDADVSAATQVGLLEDFRTRAHVVPDVVQGLLPARGNFVPLSAIGSLPEGELDGTSSASSSSWSSCEN